MSDVVISVENLSKRYDLGVIGTGTISRDLNRWWARLRGQPDPYAKIGQADHGNRLGESIWALKDVSFQVKQGEVLGIIGRNGAGKSTLLKILSQVTAPTEGLVKVKGRIGSLLEVGTGFHPELTGRENVYLNGAILGMTRAEVDRKFDEIVDFSGVEKYIDTPVKRYSSGMYVRLAFAVAAHLDPEILIVDEVLAVGDAEFQKKCLGKMSDVAHEGRTVLFVSHNMGAINSLCSNAVLIENGEIKEIASTSQVIKAYFDLLENQKVDAQNYNVQISSLSLQGSEHNILRSDHSFVITFDLALGMSFWNVIVHLTLRDQNDRVIIHERIQAQHYPILKESGKFSFLTKIPALYLKSGIYICYVKVITDATGGRERYISDPMIMNIDEACPDFENPALLRPAAQWVIRME